MVQLEAVTASKASSFCFSQAELTWNPDCFIPENILCKVLTNWILQPALKLPFNSVPGKMPTVEVTLRLPRPLDSVHLQSFVGVERKTKKDP